MDSGMLARRRSSEEHLTVKLAKEYPTWDSTGEKCVRRRLLLFR